MDAARRPFLLLAVVAAIAFVALALQLVLQLPLVTAIDPAVTHWLAAHRAPWLTIAMAGVSEVHRTLAVDAMLAVAAAVLVARRRWREAIRLALTVQAAMGLNVLVKHAFARPRPVLDVPLVHLETFSFPSGHAVASTVFWGCLVLLAPPRARRPAAGAAALVVAVVAFSRVALGAHYLSDVLAGISEGLLWVAAWGLLGPRGAARPDGPCETLRRTP